MDRRKQTKQDNSRQVRILVAACFLLTGVFLGSWLANMGGASFLHRALEQAAAFRADTLSAAFIHDAGFAVLLWVLGFFAIGAPFLAAAVLWKGMVYGYIVAGLLAQHGNLGIGIAAAGYLPQGLLLLPAYLMVAAAGIKMILTRFQVLPPKSRLRREQEKRILEYTIVLVAALAAVGAASIITIYVSPVLSAHMAQFYT